MDPTTTTGAILVGAQTFSSYLQGFAPHWIFIVAGMVGALLATLFIYSATASILLATLTTTVGLVAMAWLGFIPWWIVAVEVIATGPFVLLNFFGSGEGTEEKKTVQEITKPETPGEVVSVLPILVAAAVLTEMVKKLGQEGDMVNQLIQKSPEELAIQRGKFVDADTLVKRESTGSSRLSWNKPVAAPVYISLEDKISSMLKDTNFTKGQKSFAELKAEHDGLVMLFAGSKVNDTLINVEKTKSATEDIYTKGLSFIEQAVTTSKQVDITNYDTLKMETDELSENVKDKAQDSALYKVLKQTIDKNNNILSLVKKNKDHIDELLCQVTLCKDSIEEVRLTIPSLINYTSADDLQKSIAEVNQRVDFAQKLSNEFKAQGL